MLSRNGTNNIKAIAIILVMFGHLVTTKRISVDFDLRMFATFSVGAFLVLSGYGLTLSYIKNGLSGFIKKRLLTVVYPFIVINIIFYFYFFGKINTFDLLKTILFINPKLNIDPTMWYVYFILIWYVIFFIIFSLKINIKIKIACLFFTSALIYNIPVNSDFKAITTQFPLHSFSFSLGAFLALLKFDDKNKINFILLLSIVMFLFMYKNIITPYLVKKQFLCSILFSLSLFLFFIIFEVKSKILAFISSISYESYLIEGVTYKIKFHNNEVVNLFVYFLVTFFLAYIISILIKKSIKSIKSIN
ncbi:TPA: acyltransferase family protein [Proteus mirabilis]|nr:acyltransferase family protein [Proteus mirabilis]HEK1037773.1 acyltransferase family protein [Proteus mirabilis]